ncbi:hypothetical protein FRC17_009086 [Serendipita sp. 399]|nr:hypothetical protein FRC17_009086 [Serendipita sp. 399]
MPADIPNPILFSTATPPESLIHPEIIISYGDEVATSFEKDMFSRVWENVPESFLDDPKANPTSIETIVDSPALDIHLPSESRTTVCKLTQRIGKIVAYGPNLDELALPIPQIHYECHISIAHHLAAVDAAAGVPCANNRIDRIRQLEALARRMEEVIMDSGLKLVEDTARANLIATERASR